MKKSLVVQFMGTAIIAFVAGIAVGGYLIPSQAGPEFGGMRINTNVNPSIISSIVASTTNPIRTTTRESSRTTAVPPQPVIIQPQQGPPANMEYQMGIPVVLQGYAKSTDPGDLIGWTPCNQMTFSGTGANTFQLTPSAMANYQQTGVCQTQIIFSNLGSETIILDAWNKMNQHGQAQVTITIVTAPSLTADFDFDFTVSPTGGRNIQGQTTSYTITLALKYGSTRTVTLRAVELPQGSTYTFNPASGTPPYTSTLTIQTSNTTPVGTYNILIQGFFGQGGVRSTRVTLEVENPPQ